jgi:hypothetical protein
MYSCTAHLWHRVPWQELVHQIRYIRDWTVFMVQQGTKLKFMWDGHEMDMESK